MYEFVNNQLSFVSFSDKYWYLLVVLFLLFCLMLYKHSYRLELAFVALSMLSFPYSSLLKIFFKVPRPVSADPYLLAVDRFSFPSSHVVFYTVVFGFMIYLIERLKYVDTLIKTSVKIVLYYLILFVGLSRVWLGQHWVRDVIGGYAFGALFLLLLIQLYGKIAKTRDAKK